MSTKLNFILLECFDKIFFYFEKDQRALYTFLFVNRFWCRIIIPFLWRHPFSCTSKGKEINTLLSLLNPEERLGIINDHDNIKLSPPSTLFNYASYIQDYNNVELFQSIESWYETFYDIYYSAEIQIIFNAFTKLIMRNSKIIKNLSLLHIHKSIYHDIPEISIFVNSQPGFININKFELNTSFITPHVFDLLVSLKEISHNIQDLKIHGSSMIDKKKIDLIIQLIKAQHNLSFVWLHRFGLEFTSILETLTSIQSNSLTTLKLTRISRHISLSSIQRFKNLRNLYLRDCDGLGQNLLDNVSKVDFNLKSLELDRMTEQFLQSILKLQNENLQKISFYHNTSLKVIQDFFIRCSHISNIKVRGRQYQKGFISSLSVLESSLTSFSIYFNSSRLYQIFDELCNISLPKLTFLDIEMPKSASLLESYLRMTSSPLRTIILHFSYKISMEYINILLKFSKRKTLRIVGISLKSDEKKFKEFSKITEGCFQIVDSWDIQ
ncbi:3615_t:CDS:1 [Funneliformis caledonium]|uniref:3615_t:CDS:1 n=1 Tax=Funneliformis caledonium TaxID=1117310 RepID=A0A9N9BIE9_9GLOM|nr:3615_t:CDS:1 [Funneliformis caledonium]